MNDQPNSSGSGWKWIAGGLALVVSYQLGYSSGSSRAASTTPLNSIAVPAGQALTNSSLGLDTKMTMDSPLATTLAEPTAGDLQYPLEQSDASPAALASPAAPPIVPTATDGNQIAATTAANLAQTQLAGDDSAGSSGPKIDRASAGAAAYTATDPSTVAPTCSESGSCYGDISTATGLPRTNYVHGYTRRDGTYVRSYYRSHR